MNARPSLPCQRVQTQTAKSRFVPAGFEVVNRVARIDVCEQHRYVYCRQCCTVTCVSPANPTVVDPSGENHSWLSSSNTLSCATEKKI